mmetsp:Transcript_11213/g.20523  ORF Transcript_11213/g.20523 Transcript_11213/m.20523 type:complete len:520 (+) Transcript_11213:84-1643(+)|eukprot:CAMPEP_0201922454 /NCGR_PEP_ID=MMETSP0903-20130614/10481_1 /ASSEMBLY_ACC=CAM_ASM_000552 /TAXON_ID=420261 /ORGANISM="Thalassiosira antarctica, Strain CCMP982" /LENGTH=519 /DNA_ID=CAMNT_0048459597 /DNA_START=39 /DNA_END=1598 /DNA_ORIENTATION=+
MRYENRRTALSNPVTQSKKQRVKKMEYYMPPPEPAAAQYQQHQYAPGFPAQHYHPGPPVVFDPTSVENYTNFEGENQPTNFDVNSPPPIPMETREVLHLAAQGHPPARSMKVDTVYKKAPGAPKRFKSSYVHFFTLFMEKKKQQLGPDGLPMKLDISSVSKECSQAWKVLPAEERKYWDCVSEQEKQEYIKQKEAYEGPWRIATNKVKKKKDGAPKRSPSAFFLFANATRPVIKAKSPDMANTKVVKICSEMWKTVSDSEKAPFQEEEKKLRAQYHIEAEKWKKQMQEQQEGGEDEKKEERKGGATSMERLPPEPAPHPGHNVYMNPPGFVSPFKSAAATRPSKKRRRVSCFFKFDTPVVFTKPVSFLVQQDPNAPKRSPPAFFLFVNHCRPELKMQYPELRHTELVKMLGKKWALMSEEEKRPFRNHEEALRQQYHIDSMHYKKGAVPEQDYTNLGSLQVPMMKPQQVERKSVQPPQVLHKPRQELNYQQPTAQNQPHYQHPMKEEELSHPQTMNYFD